MLFKVCTKCGVEKPITDFYKQKGHSTGYRSVCKVCVAEYNKRYKTDNKEELKHSVKEYQKNNREKLNEISRRWYSKADKKKLREYAREWEYKRYKTDTQFRVGKQLRNRVYQALKGIDKTDTTLNLLGCSVSDLTDHLEKQFVSGMTWNNYGDVWEIDHIKP
jgi:hypothetical protein